MDYSKPTLLVISGPNGAGKSTHIQTMLPDEFAGIWSFDRDKTRSEFEVILANQQFDKTLISKRATELMEEALVVEMKKAIKDRQHFVLETPLSHADYWRYLDLFENSDYQIQLNYLCLDKVSDCTARVEQRVLEEGHYVAPETIRGVYQMNLQHINEYAKTFKAINLFDGTIKPSLLAMIEGGIVVLATEAALKKNWIKKGLPSIAEKIVTFLKEAKTNKS